MVTVEAAKRAVTEDPRACASGPDFFQMKARALGSSVAEDATFQVLYDRGAAWAEVTQLPGVSTEATIYVHAEDLRLPQ